MKKKYIKKENITIPLFSECYECRCRYCKNKLECGHCDWCGFETTSGSNQSDRKECD